MLQARSNHQLPQTVVTNRVKHVSANHIICFIDRLSGISVNNTSEKTGLTPITIRDYATTCSTYLRQNDVNLSIYGQWQRALMPAAIRAVAIHLAKGTKEVVIKYMEGNGLWSKNINIQAVSLTASVAELKASIAAEASHDPSVQAALSDIQGALNDDPGALGEAFDGTVIDDEGMMHVERSAPPPGVVGDASEGSGFNPGSACAGGREIGSSLTSKNSEKKVNVDASPDVPTLPGCLSSGDVPQKCNAESYTVTPNVTLSEGGGSETLRNDIRNTEGKRALSDGCSLSEKLDEGIHIRDLPQGSRPSPSVLRNDIRKKPEPVPRDLYTGLKVGDNFIDANGMKRKVTGVNPLESKLLRRKMRRGVNGHDRGKKTRRAKK